MLNVKRGIKTNRTINDFLNVVIGATTAVVISNIGMLVIFFRSGKYQNYGLVGAYYSLLTLLSVFLITGITANIVSEKPTSQIHHIE